MATQRINPNPNIACVPGECLVYVRETFGIGPKYPTATAGWRASAYKHRNQKFPEDMWVPLWFKLKDNPDGHVVLRQPDGSIWSVSNPTATTPMHHATLDDLESYYSGRLIYRGWTEDVEAILVIEMVKQSKQWGNVIDGRPQPGHNISPVVADVSLEIRDGMVHKVNRPAPPTDQISAVLNAPGVYLSPGGSSEQPGSRPTSAFISGT